MSYFRLSAPTRINRYPFDYHSHFTGILPVDGGGESGARPSLAKLLGDVLHKGDLAKGELSLFGFALDFMIDEATNPFVRLIDKTVAGRVQYERGECAAENVYIAAVLLGASSYLGMDVLAQPAYAPELFRAVRAQVIDKALGAPADESLLRLVRYFNRKIYSANKYTPFDDCYKLRGNFVKLLCAGDPADYGRWEPEQQARYLAWADSTFDYLAGQGIAYTQTAATEDEMPALAEFAAAYNGRNPARYKLLVHTAHQYFADGKLRGYLQAKVLPLLTGGKQLPDIVGLDLLGAENKVGNYRELFAFLRDNEEALSASFGPKGPRAAKMTVHVHCGEGSGFGPDNRSMIGYYLHEAGFAGGQFYVDFANYVIACSKAAVAKREDTPRGTRGTAVPFGLFDELFRNNSLTWQGRTLRRFDITSVRSRELAAFNAKRNMLALAEAFDDAPESGGRTWYQLLTDDEGLYTFRLGHAYHYRSYIAARYPKIAFDTNLGSNAITGASGLFGSVEGYRINRGFRHLDGYVDTGVLEAAGNAVAYMGTDALTRTQVGLFMWMSNVQQPLEKVLTDEKAAIEQQLQAVMGPIYRPDAYFDMYRNLVLQLAPEDSGALRYQALSRTLMLFANWRSYLLGADGQGAEHTDIGDEFLRMLILLGYSLLPSGQAVLGSELLDALQMLLLRISADYWDGISGAQTRWQTVAGAVLESLDGFKAPDSVVTLRRSRIR